MRKSALFILSIAILVITSYWWLVKNPSKAIVQAVGDVVATFPSQPLFNINNWLPGDSEIRSFDINNGGTDIFRLAIRTDNESNDPLSPSLASVTGVIIGDNLGTLWYGEGSASGIKTLADLYSQPYVLLGNINPGENRVFNISVEFPREIENEYQLSKTIFDIVIMKEIVGPGGEPIPAECRAISLSGTPIVGTNNKDRLIGNSGSNLIFGLSGDDMIYGNGGDDCIIGGLGNDRVIGGTGKDFIWGNEGNDRLDGGADEDNVWGGDGDDEIDGGSDNDKLWGGNGIDEMDGGSGNDWIWGENGNDLIKGGSGIDNVWGGDGDDEIDGGTSSDFLYGDAGNDSTNGSTGTDTCVAEVKIKCEL